MPLAHILILAGVGSFAENLGGASTFVGGHGDLLLDVPLFSFFEALGLMHHPFHAQILPEIDDWSKPLEFEIPLVGRVLLADEGGDFLGGHVAKLLVGFPTFLQRILDLPGSELEVDEEILVPAVVPVIRFA